MAWINTQIFFIFLFWYCPKAVQIHGATEAVPPHFNLVNVRSLKPKPYCQRSSSGPIIGSQKLQIIPRNGPCYNATGKKITSSDELLHLDEVRVRSINNRNNKFYSNDLSGNEHIGVDLNYGGDGHSTYLVTIGLGTPKQDFHLEMDTGSEWTWVRCKPCAKGCESRDPLYDPSKSSTYKKGACKGMTGSGDEPFTGRYADKSTTNGVWGCDTLTLEDFGVTSNFQFGCGQDNFDNTHNNFGDAAGILGLGRGEYSLSSQTASTSKSGQMFSYCFPLLNSQMGNLYFGDEAKSRSLSTSPKFTPLLKGDKRDFYYVDLVGISVAGKKLNVPSTIFTSPGTVIDSGTVVTRLPRQVYSALRGAFRQSMLKYKLIKGKDKLLDTCYVTRGYGKIALPEITFHFGGGTDVTLTNNGIVWFPNDNKGVMCLAFAATDGMGIIGNVQQRGLNILYDLQGERIGFGSSTC